MKKIIFTLTAMAVASVAFSQQRTGTGQQQNSTGSFGEIPESGVNIGAAFSLPIGSGVSDVYSTGANVYLEYDHGVALNVAGFVQMGYTNYFSSDEEAGNAGIVTFLLGAKYDVSEHFGIGAGVGIAHGFVVDIAEGTTFAFSPLLTYKFSNAKVSANLSYNPLSYDGINASSVNFGISVKL